MAIFTPDEKLRFHIMTMDPWNGYELARTTDSADEALAWFEQAKAWGVERVCVYDTHKHVTIAKHEPHENAWSTAKARW